ncbi:hypothetical protein JTB14_034113 [Gonioctena quinquepunctata]|nr:hypothetical protein JTB14_034113 [Gonioctena quinquepunctata]
MESENFNPKKCCVPDCEDLYSKRHRFPRPDREVELFKIWVDKVKNPLFNGKTDEQIYKTYLVCDVHFRNDFKVVSHRGLSKIAFPTLYLLDQEQGSEFLVPIINPGEGTSTSRLELHEIHSHNAVGNSSSCASLIVGKRKKSILQELNLKRSQLTDRERFMYRKVMYWSYRVTKLQTRITSMKKKIEIAERAGPHLPQTYRSAYCGRKNKKNEGIMLHTSIQPPGGILDEENLTVDLISTLSLLLLLGLYVFLIWLLEVGTVRNICVPYNN